MFNKEELFDHLGEAYKRGFIDGYTKFERGHITTDELNEIIDIVEKGIKEAKQK